MSRAGEMISALEDNSKFISVIPIDIVWNLSGDNDGLSESKMLPLLDNNGQDLRTHNMTRDL